MTYDDIYRPTEFWFNTHTKEVVEGAQGMSSAMLGPFKTRAEAARAEYTVSRRASEWAEEEAEEDR